MIYFIKDTMNNAVKIGYSKNPPKRLNNLQTSTPNPLVLLGTIPGGLEHEAGYHHKFHAHRLQGEWFKGVILPDILAIIAKSSDEQPKQNVIVIGASDLIYLDGRTVNATVGEALDELHAKIPIAWVITGGDRPADRAAWAWANKHKVDVYYYSPNWRKYGRFAGFKVGPQLLRSMFDPKLLLAFLSSPATQSTLKLIDQAKKRGIPVVTKQFEARQYDRYVTITPPALTAASAGQ